MMKHLSEEEFVLHYYGERAEGVEEHLGVCGECREQFRRLQLVLNTVSAAEVPERGPEYGIQVWQRLKPKGYPGRNGWLRWFRSVALRPWLIAPVMAALLVFAFFAGRHYPSSSHNTNNASNVRERILLVAVGDHLDRSQMVLAELTHAAPEGERFDISDQQKAAADLVDANRLYRQTAQRTGDAAVAGVLDDLERVLMEIANGPTEVSAEHLADLQNRIHDQGLLFKVRVLDAQVRQRERAPAVPENTKSL